MINNIEQSQELKELLKEQKPAKKAGRKPKQGKKIVWQAKLESHEVEAVMCAKGKTSALRFLVDFFLRYESKSFDIKL